MEKDDKKTKKKFDIKAVLKVFKLVFSWKSLLILTIIAIVLLMSFLRVLDKNKFKEAKPYKDKSVKSVRINNDSLELNKRDLQKLQEYIEKNYKGLDIKYAETFLRAELAGKYPDLGGDKNQGILHIKRSNKDTDTNIHPKDRPDLEYLDEADFDAMIEQIKADGIITEEEVAEAKQYYTLTKDENEDFTGDLKVIYATKVEIRQKQESSSGGYPVIDISQVEPQTTFEINEQIIPYQVLVEQYVMHFQFLLSLYQVTYNQEWVKCISNLVLDGSQIVIEIQESETKTTETTINQWKDLTRTLTGYDMVMWVNPQTQVSEPREEPNFEETETYTTQVEQKITTQETLEANVTYANTWIVEKLQEYNIVYNETYPLGEATVAIASKATETDPGEPEEGTWTIESSATHTVVTNTAEWVKGQTQQISSNEGLFLGTIANEKGKYQKPFDDEGKVNQEALFPENRENAKRIEYILPSGGKECPSGKLISEADSGWIFELLQTDEALQNEEQILRYLLYRYTGEDKYGVTALDFSIFDDRSFTSSGIAGGSSMTQAFIHQFENSNISDYMTPDGKAYYVYHGGEQDTPNPTVGYGVNLVAHYDKFAAHGFQITQEQVKQWQDRMIAGEEILKDVTIDKEIVDAVEAEIYGNFDKLVDNYLALYNIELTSYQKAALVSRAYQYGNINGFAAAYYGVSSDTQARGASASSATWTESDTEKYYRQNVDESIYNHPIYVNFFKDSYENRRKQEWRMFVTGFNSATTTYYPKSTDLLKLAEELHQHMENNKYTYSQDGGRLPSSYEQCYTKPYTCCATYVSWALHESGYDKTLTHSSGNLYNQYKNEFEFISNYNDLQPGDIVFFKAKDNNSMGFGHVEIYNGDDTWFGAGSTDTIRAGAPKASGNRSSSFWGALRPN